MRVRCVMGTFGMRIETLRLSPNGGRFFVCRRATLRREGKGRETTMRYPILPIVIAFVVAAPCTALAGEKQEKSIEIQSYQWGVSNAGSVGSGSGTSQRDISSGQATGKRQYKPVTILRESSGPGGGNPTAGKPLTTTVNPALKGNTLPQPNAGWDVKANRKY
jgi:hypothetical protein